LSFVNCAFAQYLVGVGFAKSDCSGTSLGFLAIPTGCTNEGGLLNYQTANCNNGAYTVSSCADGTCVACAVKYSNSTSCSVSPLYSNQYATVSCGALPSLKNNVISTYYSSASCSGSVIQINGNPTGVCIPITGSSGSTMASCNSTLITTIFYSDNACMNITNNSTITIGCNGGAKFACGAANSRWNPNHVLYLLCFALLFLIKSKN